MASASNNPDQAMVNKSLANRDLIVWTAPVNFAPANVPLDMEEQIPNFMQRLRTLTVDQLDQATQLGQDIEEIQFWMDELPSIDEEDEEGNDDREEQTLRWERMQEIDAMIVPITAKRYAWDTGVNVRVVMAYYLGAKCWLKDNNCIFPEDWLGEDSR